MTLTGARWSAAVRCPRWGALTALNVEGAEPTHEAREYMNRGKVFEAYVTRQLQAKYGEGEVLSQLDLPWACGTAHPDAYVRSERLLVEVFSTVAPRGLAVEQKVDQLRGYWVFCERAGYEVKGALVYVIDPRRLRRADAYPVTLTDEAREWVLRLEADMHRAQTNGADLPPCSKTNPTECRFSGCPYYEVAWADWQEPEPAELQASPELAELLVELDAAKSRESAARSLNNAEHRRCQEIQNELANLGVPAGKSKVGPFEIRRTPVRGRETFSVAMARKAGAWGALEDEMLGAFMKVGEPHERWELRRVSDEVLVGVDDYGEEIPF